MNSNFNYSGFIEMFLESDDEFESYGVISEGLELLEPQPHSARSEKYVLAKTLLQNME